MCVLDDPDLRRSPIIKHLCGSDQVQSLPPGVTQKKQSFQEKLFQDPTKDLSM